MMGLIAIDVATCCIPAPLRSYRLPSLPPLLLPLPPLLLLLLLYRCCCVCLPRIYVYIAVLLPLWPPNQVSPCMLESLPFPPPHLVFLSCFCPIRQTPDCHDILQYVTVCRIVPVPTLLPVHWLGTYRQYRGTGTTMFRCCVVQ